jgi:hypothetical protein
MKQKLKNPVRFIFFYTDGISGQSFTCGSWIDTSEKRITSGITLPTQLHPNCKETDHPTIITFMKRIMILQNALKMIKRSDW